MFSFFLFLFFITGLSPNLINARRYYELLQEAAFKEAPERNVTDWLIRRAHRRYGLSNAARNTAVTEAWAALGASGYAIDKGVGDGTGVCQMDVFAKLKLADVMWNKTADGNITSPGPPLCLEWASWGSFNAAGAVLRRQVAHQQAHVKRLSYVMATNLAIWVKALKKPFPTSTVRFAVL